MLILTRRTGQLLMLGKEPLVVIKFMKIKDNKALLGIQATKDISIIRGEIYNKKPTCLEILEEANCPINEIEYEHYLRTQPKNHSFVVHECADDYIKVTKIE